MGVVEAEITRRRLCILRKRVLRIFSVSNPSTVAGGVLGGKRKHVAKAIFPPDGRMAKG